MNTSIDFSTFKDQENNYIYSGTALKNQREFSVGCCKNNLNGQKVMNLHQKKHIEHRIFGPLYPSHVFEGEMPNSNIIGWRIKCTRPFDDDYGGSWKRVNKIIGTNHFNFSVTSCFMRDLDWEIDIYYI